MFTAAAARSAAAGADTPGVISVSDLLAGGCTRAEIRARVAARRWQRIGTAIVVHNSDLSREDRWRVAVVNCGPRAVLAAFSAGEYLGLTGWGREEVHVLAPAGVARPQLSGIPLVLHRCTTLDPAGVLRGQRCQRMAHALVLAASSFPSARPGCGLLASGVQQRRTTATELREVIAASPRLRHRRALLAAVGDIGMGAEALSEIDFVRLCRRHGLPTPVQQTVRVEPGGRRRYLDVEWVLPDGRRVVVEVDGAVHLTPRRWYDDQVRQNEIVLGGALVLRFPTVVVRTEELLVVRQLRRALFGRR